MHSNTLYCIKVQPNAESYIVVHYNTLARYFSLKNPPGIQSEIYETPDEFPKRNSWCARPKTKFLMRPTNIQNEIPDAPDEFPKRNFWCAQLFGAQIGGQAGTASEEIYAIWVWKDWEQQRVRVETGTF